MLSSEVYIVFVWYAVEIAAIIALSVFQIKRIRKREGFGAES